MEYGDVYTGVTCIDCSNDKNPSTGKWGWLGKWYEKHRGHKKQYQEENNNE